MGFRVKEAHIITPNPVSPAGSFSARRPLQSLSGLGLGLENETIRGPVSTGC